MTARFFLFLYFFTSAFTQLKAQCGSAIAVFPYRQDFEAGNGGWFSGGTGSSWAWGTISKPVILAAASGTKGWTTGGLTGSSYTNGEASWIQSPCFDFTNLKYPYVSMNIFWETEQQFDGASFQYSLDNGSTWFTVGAAGETDCLSENWYNQDPVTYLSALTSTKQGWSGNSKPAGGSCKGGNGSNAWVKAAHTIPSLGGIKSVVFRFLFGAGTICNNYDGFAFDDLLIEEAPLNNASFTYNCINKNTVEFANTSTLCPSVFSWNFGDPASGSQNTSSAEDPTHIFTAPGEYTVTLTVSSPGNGSSVITNKLSIASLSTAILTPANCVNNDGGSATVNVVGAAGPFTYLWNTVPVQTNATATNLKAGTYAVTVSGAGMCSVDTSVLIPTDLSCIGVFFPTAFTPDGNGVNDLFGALGSLTAISNYHLRIYNRWGKLVFYTENPFAKWDGRVNGKTADGNLFVWKADFSLANNKQEMRQGTVLLMR